MAPNNEVFKKGCKVEVTRSGFDGTLWYVATLIDKKTEGYLVRYDTLFENVGDENLCETVEPRFVRPIPPDSKEMVDDDYKFKMGDIIDAYHKDGWWVGVIKNVLKKVSSVVKNNVKESGSRTYLVRFENPLQGEVEFEKHLLRFHLDWVDSCWKPPLKNKEIYTLSDTNSTLIELVTADANIAQSGFTRPSRAARPTVKENPSARKSSRLQQNTKTRKTRTTLNSAVANSQASAGGKRKETVQLHMMERSGSQAMHQDSPIVEREAINKVSNFGNLMASNSDY